MAIPEPVVFPIEMACPQCRFIVWVTEADAVPGEVATCKACNVPLENPDAARRAIIDEARNAGG